LLVHLTLPPIEGVVLTTGLVNVGTGVPKVGTGVGLKVGTGIVTGTVVVVGLGRTV